MIRKTFFCHDICLRFYVFNRGRALALTNIIILNIANNYQECNNNSN